MASKKTIFHLIIISLFFLFSAFYFVTNIQSKALLKGVVFAITNDIQGEEEKVKMVVNWIHENNMKRWEIELPEQLQLGERFNPLTKLIKRTSVQTLFLGGDCGKLTRLTVNMLDELNVQSHRFHLYNKQGCYDVISKGGECADVYVHAVLEYEVNGKKSVIDPSYNLIYPHTMAELKSNPDTIKKYVPEIYSTDLYIYDNPRGIRWSIVGGEKLGEFVYDVFVKLFGKEKTDNIHYPFLFENPNLLFSLLLFFCGMIYLILFLVKK